MSWTSRVYHFAHTALLTVAICCIVSHTVGRLACAVLPQLVSRRAFSALSGLVLEQPSSHRCSGSQFGVSRSSTEMQCCSGGAIVALLLSSLIAQGSGASSPLKILSMLAFWGTRGSICVCNMHTRMCCREEYLKREEENHCGQHHCLLWFFLRYCCPRGT